MRIKSEAVWWLLDVETSGLNQEKDSVIALRLARLENLETLEERTILIQPEQPLTPWAEKLTGISNHDLSQAGPLRQGLEHLDTFNQTGRFLLLDRGFTLSFLKNAYERCGMVFKLDCLPLDQLAERLGFPGRKKAANLLEMLPPVPADWPDVPPRDGELKKLYRLTLALFHQWEESK